MATIKRITTGTSNINTWKNFFDSLNCPIITTSVNGTTLTITVNEDVTITLSNFNSNFLTIVYTRNGSSTSGNTIFSNQSERLITITACSSDNLFYVQFKDGDSRRQVVVYEKLADINISGYNFDNSTGRAFIDISSLNLTDGINTYKHGTRLNYSVELGYIDYTDECLFISGVKSIEDPNFIACSTVTADNVISMGGINYYSVGAHTLVLMDD